MTQHPFKSILLVDDDVTFLNATAELLRREGFSCSSAASTEEAAGFLSIFQYDLLISDRRMPGNLSLEFIKTAKKTDPKMPFILLTGYPTRDSAVHSVNLSAAAFLVKPVGLKELVKHIYTAIELAQINNKHDPFNTDSQLYNEELIV